MEYRIENLTKEEAESIGRKINEIVPREVDADEEEFILKIENASSDNSQSVSSHNIFFITIITNPD